MKLETRIGINASGSCLGRLRWVRAISPLAHMVATVCNAPVSLNPLLWYPCFAYYAWIGYLATLNVRFPRGNGELLAWGFVLLQSVVILAAIAAVDGWVASKFSRAAHVACASLIHLFFAGLYLDSIVYKNLQIHLGRALELLFEDGLARVPAIWSATGVSSAVLHRYLVGSGLVLVFLPLFVFAAVRCTARSSRSVKAWNLLLVMSAAWGGSVALKAMDARKGWDSRFHDVIAALPFQVGWKPAIKGVKYSNVKLRPPGNENAPVISFPKTRPEILPDIFIILLESTRADCINGETAPNLTEFSKECFPLNAAFAASNSSHTSWYSILTGNHALYFGIEKRAAWHAGSRPIALLRSWGYKVLVFCSSTLDYHDVDVMSFGSDLALCDQMFDAEKQGIHGVPERDGAVNKAVLEEIPRTRGGRLFLIFYHCTHHDYSWPESHPAKFVPYAKAWNYSDFRIVPERLTLIRNRYLNAVNFEDALVGDLFQCLKRTARYDSSVICALGDHGEEFLEHGKLLHASNIYRPQTEIPFLLRFPPGTEPMNQAHRRPPTASHVDLFPTLIDYVAGKETEGWSDGESLFRKTGNQVVIAAQNGDRDPVQFCIRSPEYCAFFQFRSDTEPTLWQRTLFLKQITDSLDDPTNSLGNEPFRSAQFGDAFRSLFPNAEF